MNTIFRMLLLVLLALGSLGFLDSQAQAGSVADAFKPVARFGTGPVNALAYSPDGSTLAVGSTAGVTFYDAQTLSCTGVLLGVSEVTALAWVSDNQLLVGTGDPVGYTGSLALWDITSKEQVVQFPFVRNAVLSLALSADGQWASAAAGDYWSGYRLYKWPMSNPESVLATRGSPAVAISTSNLLAYRENDNSLHLWDLAQDRETASWPEEHAKAMAFSADGKLLAVLTGGVEWALNVQGVIKVYNVADKALIASLRGEGGPLAFSPDGKLLAVGLTLWDTATLRQSAVLRVDYKWTGGNISIFVSSVAFSPNGTLTTGFNGIDLGIGYDDAAVRFWNVAEGKEVGKIPAHDMGTSKAIFSSDSKLLVSNSLGNYLVRSKPGLYLWDLNQRRQANISASLPSYYVSSFAFSPDGKLAVAVDNGVNMWDTSTWRMMSTLGVESGVISSLTFSPDAKLLAATIGNGVMANVLSPVVVWDVGRGQQVYKWADAVYTFGGEVGSFLAFSPDGTTLAAVGYNESVVRLWSVVARREVAQLEHVNYAYGPTFSPDGKYLAVGSADFLVHLWDVATKEEVAVMKGFMSVFTPEGKFLLSTDVDKIRIWDVSTREQVGVLQGFADGDRRVLFSLSVSPDGKYLATTISGGIILVWEIGLIPDPTTAVEGEEGEESVALPTRMVLHNNYPNPFNSETTIRYELPMAGSVRLVIYDLLGHKIRTLVQGIQAAGYHTAIWNGRDEQGREVASGVYFYRLEAGGSRNEFGMTAQTKRMVLLR